MEFKFKNREAIYPNRIKLNPVVGQNDIYDIERADGAAENSGTPLNAENLNGAFESLEEKIVQTKSNLEEKIVQIKSYVGQIMIFDYTGITVSDENKFDTAVKMKNFFGGTWQAYAPGRVLAGIDSSQTEFNTIGKEGGAKTHTLTESEMPSHNHAISNKAISGTNSSYPNNYYNPTSTYTLIGDGTIGYKGGGTAHNNLQPYKVVYMWRRIS